MLMTSSLLPTPDVNISHHIMQQASEHEAACDSLGGREEAGESRGGKEWERENDWQGLNTPLPSFTVQPC